MASAATLPTGNDVQIPDTSKAEGNLDLDWLLHKKGLMLLNMMLLVDGDMPCCKTS